MSSSRLAMLVPAKLPGAVEESAGETEPWRIEH